MREKRDYEAAVIGWKYAKVVSSQVRQDLCKCRSASDLLEYAAVLSDCRGFLEQIRLKSILELRMGQLAQFGGNRKKRMQFRP